MSFESSILTGIQSSLNPILKAVKYLQVTIQFKLHNVALASALLICLLAVLTFTSVHIHVVHGCGINIVNNCSNSVTTCAQSGENPISQYQLGSGASQYLNFSSSCQWNAGAIYESVTGQCANPNGSANATDRNLANLAEFTIGASSGTDYYDLSNINAYNVGLGISVTSSAGGECTHITCSISDIRTFCTGSGNKLVTEPSGALACINTGCTSGTGPTPDGDFKTACPQAFDCSDDTGVTFTCNTGSDYQVTFCP